MPASIETIGAELREFLLQRNRTQREIAGKLGISPGHLSTYLNGNEQISRNVADKLKELYPELNKGYLMSGEGRLFSESSHNIGSVTNSHNVVNGNYTADCRQLEEENERLREQVSRMEEERGRLLWIIETLSKK